MMQADEFLKLTPKRAQGFAEKASRRELEVLLMKIYRGARE